MLLPNSLSGLHLSLSSLVTACGSNFVFSSRCLTDCPLGYLIQPSHPSSPPCVSLQSTTIPNYPRLFFFYPRHFQKLPPVEPILHNVQIPLATQEKRPLYRFRGPLESRYPLRPSTDNVLPRWWHSTNPQYTFQAVALRSSRERTPETEEPIQSPLDGKEYRHPGHQPALLRFV